MTGNQPFVRLTRSSTRLPTPYDAESQSEPKSHEEQSFSTSMELGSPTFFSHSNDADSLDVRLMDMSKQDEHSSSPSLSHKHSRPRGRLVHFQASSPVTGLKQTSVGKSATRRRNLVSPPGSSASDSDSLRSRLPSPSRRLRSRSAVTILHPSVGDHQLRTFDSCLPATRNRLRSRVTEVALPADVSIPDHGHCNKSARCSGGRDEDDEGGAVSSDRRYPIRNRRHTAMYQVEYPQHNHGSARNWLAGTGYENGGRRRSRGLHRNRHSRSLHHCGSSTSSSDDSSSESSMFRRNVVAESSAHRTPSHSSWRHTNASPGATAAQVDDEEVRFARRCTKSILHSRSELMPINLKRKDIGSTLNNRLLSGSSLADIEPMSVDESVGFDHVGGHEKHIIALKESILLPLMYPEVFSLFDIDPPRGILFSGPPGTGKTLLARALANECSRFTSREENNSNQDIPPRRPIAFFMRKGADCLSKWVGESERQLRLLFDQAYRMRPSIIFFDEIDGLAPVRSSKQDQIHSSIVSTLLSLMDGLDARAEVVIIGATNRPDAIDPALRRPGRFDREFAFGLPCESVRLQILKVHTSKWDPKPDVNLLNQIAKVTGNFSGADLKAVVTEACLFCLRRQYPQVYHSRVKLHLDPKYLLVEREDWMNALQSIRPSNCRSDADASCTPLTLAANAQFAAVKSPLPTLLASLLGETVELLARIFCHALKPWAYPVEDLVKLVDTLDICYSGTFTSHRFLIIGDIPAFLMNAVWHRLELLQVFTVSFTSAVAFPLGMGLSPEAAIAQILSAVKRATNTDTSQSHANGETVQGVILYLPRVDVLLSRLTDSTALYLVDHLEALAHELVLEELASTSAHPLNYAEEFCRAVSARPRRLIIVATIQHHLNIAPPRGCSANWLPRGDSPELHPSDGMLPIRQSISPTAKPTSPDPTCNGIRSFRMASLRSKSSRHIMSSTYINVASPSAINANNHSLRSSPECDLLSVESASSPSSDGKSLGPEGTSSDHRILPENFNTLSAHDFGMNNLLFGSAGDDVSSQLVGAHDKARLRRLVTRLFSRTSSMHIRVTSPNRTARDAFFSSLLDIWLPRGTQESETTVPNVVKRPPTPLPIIESAEDNAKANSVAPLSPEELLQIEHEEAQLFRRLRQILRRVVAHLARHRRFAVFTRPVQVDEAPDYYDVIKIPMDLGSIRDRIDNRHYTNVEDFMKDIELIYYNALEYNPPNVPRSRDIRSRASEFWDEACLQIEEELHPPDLNELCKAAAAAQRERSEYAVRVGKTPCDCRVSKAPITSTPEKSSFDESQPSVKPLPLPQGPRYSRRVHGESPLLQTSDIAVFQKVTRRRASSNSTAESIPESKRPREKSCVDEHAVDLDANINSNSRSSGSRSSEGTHTMDLASRKSASSISTPIQGVISPPTQFSVSGALSTSSFISTKNTSLWEKAKLEAFIRTVVDGSQGWSVQQLMQLYRELSCIMLTAPLIADKQLPAIVSRMERTFRAFVKRHGR